MNGIIQAGSLLLLASVLGCAAPVGDAEETPPATNESPERKSPVKKEGSSDNGNLAVKVKGFRNWKGQLAVSLFPSPDGFPDDAKKACRRLRQKIEGESVNVRMEEVPFGDYAIAVLHDEDMNGVLGRGFLGIPTEGAGASNNPPPRRGPPKYDEAQFTLKREELKLEITLHYPDQ